MERCEKDDRHTRLTLEVREKSERERSNANIKKHKVTTTINIKKITLEQIKTQEGHPRKLVGKANNIKSDKVDTRDYAVDRCFRHVHKKRRPNCIVRWYVYSCKCETVEALDSAADKTFYPPIMKAFRQTGGHGKRANKQMTFKTFSVAHFTESR